MKVHIQNYLRWLFGGMLCSFCADTIDIWLLFHLSPSIWAYLYFLFLTIAVSCIIAFIVRTKKIHEFIISIVFVIIGIYLFETIFYVLDIYRWFYFIAYPTSTEVAIGQSLITVVVWISEAVGLAIGFVFVFVRNIIKGAKGDSSHDTPLP